MQLPTSISQIKSEFFELVRFGLMVLIIVIPIRMFIAQPFIVNGESMLPTFENGDYLIIDEVSYLKNDPKRGEVIVFHFPTNQSRYLIKRVIGLPGETVLLQGESVTIINSDGSKIELDETYTNIGPSYGSWALGEDEYFVLGDNRGASSDSRSWGALPRKDIVGKTFVRLYPFSKINMKPGQVEASQIEKPL